MSEDTNRRILVIDDTPSIHEDFKKTLVGDASDSGELDQARAALFGDDTASAVGFRYDLDCAFQGEEGLARVRAALAEGRPFALAYVDMRMPPGWDGVETIQALWREDPRLQVVICTAFSDHSWDQMIEKLGVSDRLLLIKKPFDPVEVRQSASALSEKWSLARQADVRLTDLELQVEQRTHELAEANAALNARLEALRLAEQEARARAEQLGLKNSSLAEANRIAQSAARSKTEFLANMSHEIRTPMTAILGFADLLLDPALPHEERKGYVQTIRRNGDHLLTILNDILDLSKIEAGRMRVESMPFSPVELLVDVVSLLRVRAMEKGLSLETSFDGPLPTSIANDPTRLRQILLNLIGNAIKFTQRGGVEVRVRLESPEAGTQSGGLIAFEVRDSGIGIAPEKLLDLFQPFTQADSSAARQFGGTGLGLSISRRLAGLLGGDIRVESTPGHGSLFTARVATGALHDVPLVSDMYEALKQVAPSPLETNASGLQTLSGRILLAEDGRDNQRLISLILRKAGAEVEIAENGKLALEAVLGARGAARPFDLILMDMQMPELDGYGATRALRSEGWRGPIIALTAHAMSGDRERCLEAGCDDYATKPIDRRVLLETCAGALGRGVKAEDESGA